MTLREAIEQYVLWRQVHGAKFTTVRNLLRQFLRHADGDAGCDAVTTEQVRAFLAGDGRLTRHRKNKAYALAGFWRYAISRGYAPRSPLPDGEPRSPLRAPPYIYTRDELWRLLDRRNVQACRRGARQLDAATFRTLLLLLYGAGLRFSEATGLTLADVDLPDAILTVWDTTRAASSRSGPNLQRRSTAACTSVGVTGARKARRPACWGTGTARASPARGLRCAATHRRCARRRRRTTGSRLHDLRHSFAVHSLTAWYRQEADVQRLLPVLSTYLGHSELEGTRSI
jgi:integrase